MVVLRRLIELPKTGRAALIRVFAGTKTALSPRNRMSPPKFTRARTQDILNRDIRKHNFILAH
jgi:hypothetical protein